MGKRCFHPLCASTSTILRFACTLNRPEIWHAAFQIKVGKFCLTLLPKFSHTLAHACTPTFATGSFPPPPLPHILEHFSEQLPKKKKASRVEAARPAYIWGNGGGEGGSTHLQKMRRGGGGNRKWRNLATYNVSTFEQKKKRSKCDSHRRRPPKSLSLCDAPPIQRCWNKKKNLGNCDR